MPSNPKRIIITIALATGLAVVGTLAFTSVRPRGNTSAQVSKVPEVGAHGGTLLENGTYALEVVQSEQGGNATFTLYPMIDGKPFKPARNALTATLERYDGTRRPLPLVPSGDGFKTTEPTPKPHVFDVKIVWQAAGATRSFDYARDDGTVVLRADQIASAKINIAQAGPGIVVDSFQLPGEIKFDADRTAQIVPRVAGVVEQVAVSLGQQVAKGQVLAVIASADLSDRRSELLAAQKRLTGAQQAYSREKKLWEERISAEQDYQAAQVQLREAEISVQNAQQKLSAINASANGMLNRYELRAPFAGTIVEKRITPGEAVAADANAFVLSDLSTVWAEMAIPAQRLNDVRVGKQATVIATAFESQARGKIVYVGALLGAQTRTAPARVVLPNPGGIWRPGMFANITVDSSAQMAPVTIETEALQTVDGVPTVFVQSKHGFVAQPVQLGRRSNGRTEVTRGLRAGQRYVATNSFVLKSDLEKGTAEGH
ncbi:efflux RND transporter periplasmic adaptor subunit [Burkholderia cepacia]|uniref:efflux RND transporter periplasmic adaptor subunit n=1 Tax=Burkholderia cepacia TaxID=292 RepID=UPI002AB7E210|nr:efflux RND transporter periplasmic adaptor subunit [Burkholderia cepacia]